MVGLAKADDFNDTVAMDLHQLGSNIWYLDLTMNFLDLAML